MVTFVSDETAGVFRIIAQKFAPYANRGWMCEGSTDANGRPANYIFNNRTGENIKADYDGNIISKFLTDTPESDAKEMAQIQGDMRKVLSY